VAEAKPYLSIVSHLESCLEAYGDTHRGVDWPVAQDVPTRHRIMLEVVREWPSDETIRLLDFGCGASGFYEYILERGIEVDYSGLDLSRKFVDVSKSKFPGNAYYYVDILDEGVELPQFDYITMNGVFTVKRDLSFDQMLEYVKSVLVEVFELANVGIAFNVMSKQVEWERDDLFHLPFDVLADFLTRELSRDFVFRNDYGLFEYTTYVYR
jgi:SAM-dependent methyltransferase